MKELNYCYKAFPCNCTFITTSSFFSLFDHAHRKNNLRFIALFNCRLVRSERRLQIWTRVTSQIMSRYITSINNRRKEAIFRTNKIYCAYTIHSWFVKENQAMSQCSNLPKQCCFLSLIFCLSLFSLFLPIETRWGKARLGDCKISECHCNWKAERRSARHNQARANGKLIDDRRK